MGTFFFLLGTRKGREKNLPKEMKESLEVDGSAAKDGAESVVAKARAPSPMTTMSQRIFGHDKTGKEFTRAEDDSPPNNIDGSENSYEQIAMSGLDMPGLGPGADDLVSPSRKMTQKLRRQEPNQLYKFSRLWVQVAIPVCILLCIISGRTFPSPRLSSSTSRSRRGRRASSSSPQEFLPRGRRPLRQRV